MLGAFYRKKVIVQGGHCVLKLSEIRLFLPNKLLMILKRFMTEFRSLLNDVLFLFIAVLVCRYFSGIILIQYHIVPLIT